MSLVLVGELNPYGGRPEYALYCEPAGSSGARLRRILGLSESSYLSLRRYNLCVGRWTLASARARAIEIDARHQADAIVLLGRRVGAAFGLSPLHPFFQGTARASAALGFTVVGHRMRYVLLPHPSGRCLAWNEPGAVDRARSLLRDLCSDVPIGEEP